MIDDPMKEQENEEDEGRKESRCLKEETQSKVRPGVQLRSTLRVLAPHQNRVHESSAAPLYLAGDEQTDAEEVCGLHGLQPSHGKELVDLLADLVYAAFLGSDLDQQRMKEAPQVEGNPNVEEPFCHCAMLRQIEVYR